MYPTFNWREFTMKRLGYMISTVALSFFLTFLILVNQEEKIILAATETGYVKIIYEKIKVCNDGIERIIDVSNSKMHTTEVFNKRIKKKLVPQNGSEDFLIQFVSEDDTIKSSDLTIKEIKEVDYNTGKKVQVV